MVEKTAVFTGVVTTTLLFMFIASALGALVTALFVQIATSMVAKFRPAYGRAYLATFVGSLSCACLGFVIGFSLAASGIESGLASSVCLLILGFLVCSWIFGVLLKHPETGPVGFKTGMRICLSYTGIFILLILVGAALYWVGATLYWLIVK